MKIKSDKAAKLAYHLQLLAEAGFIKTVQGEDKGLVPVRITWAGHEYINKSLNSLEKDLKLGINLLDEVEAL